MSFRLVTVRMAWLVCTLRLGTICLAQDSPAPSRPGQHGVLTGRTEGLPTAVSPGNWSQSAKLTPGSGNFIFDFGTSVGISGDTAIVNNLPSDANPAVAYVFHKSARGWSYTLPVARLSETAALNLSTAPLAIDGDTIVMGAPSGYLGYPSYVFVYVKSAAGWTDMAPTAILTPFDSDDGSFGASVSISGDTVVVGDLGGYGTLTSGAAYVFVKPATGWVNGTQTAKLTASDVLPTDLFGEAVSVGGNTVAVGAPQGVAPGKAYVFVKPTTGWSDMTQTALLTASDAQTGSEVGWSVSVSGDNVLVGAPSNTLNHPPGHAYLFTKPSSGWTNMTETAELLSADGRSNDDFGYSVAIAGSVAAVGALGRGVTPFASEGGVYVFEEPAGGWQNMTGHVVLTGSDARYYALFGYSVGVSGKTVVGGTRALESFGAYVFGLP